MRAQKVLYLPRQLAVTGYLYDFKDFKERKVTSHQFFRVTTDVLVKPTRSAPPNESLTASRACAAARHLFIALHVSFSVAIHGWVLLFGKGFRGLIARPVCRRRRASALAVLVMGCGFCGLDAKQAVRIGQLESIVSTNGTQPSASAGARSSEAGSIRSSPACGRAPRRGAIVSSI